METLNCVFNGCMVLTTAVIGFMAYKISARQLEIAKHKRNDFLYNKRFQIYQDLRNIMTNVNSELWALNNKEIECIDSRFVRPLYNKLSILIGDAELLFDDKQVLIFMQNIQYDIACLFGVNDVKIVDDAQKLTILNKWNKYISSGCVAKLFQPYLKLV